MYHINGLYWCVNGREVGSTSETTAMLCAMNHRLLSMCDGLVEQTHVAIELGAKLKDNCHQIQSRQKCLRCECLFI